MGDGERPTEIVGCVVDLPDSPTSTEIITVESRHPKTCQERHPSYPLGQITDERERRDIRIGSLPAELQGRGIPAVTTKYTPWVMVENKCHKEVAKSATKSSGCGSGYTGSRTRTCTWTDIQYAVPLPVKSDHKKSGSRSCTEWVSSCRRIPPPSGSGGGGCNPFGPGRVLIDFDPEADAGEGDCGEEVSCELVMADRDASKVLELVEETFHEVALAVQVMGCGALLPAVPLGRDVGARAVVGNELEDGAGVIAAVGDGVPGRLKAVKESRHGSLVGGLARGEREAARQAKAVDDDMDFGAQPASRASDGVVRTPFFPPTACRCAGCERSR